MWVMLRRSGVGSEDGGNKGGTSRAQKGVLSVIFIMRMAGAGAKQEHVGNMPRTRLPPRLRFRVYRVQGDPEVVGVPGPTKT